MVSSNPLVGFFRQPAIYIKLPSQGNFWSNEALSLPVTGEIPVYPMTTKDEITLKTPDALLNGAGVVDVIRSCCPNILNPWEMPSIDVDAVLISIRIASYGSKMEIESICPHCAEENSYEVDLNNTQAQITVPDYSSPLIVNGLIFKFHPQKYFSVNKTNLTNFEEQRIIQAINSEDLPEEEKTKIIAEHLERLVQLNIKIMVDSTESITTPTGEKVTDPTFITEFYNNSDRAVVKAVRTRIEEFASQASIKPVLVNCSSCSESFNLKIQFDYANFFV